MSNTSEILKSLAVLEQNLNDINSAKQQVIEVVDSSKALAQVIESYKASFEGLSSSVQNVFRESKNLNLEAVTSLQVKIDDLKMLITRLETIDLEKHFDRHQEMLSKVFGTINSLNLTFSGLAQILIEIRQGFGNMQNSIDATQNEILTGINQLDVVLGSTNEIIDESNVAIYSYINNLQKIILNRMDTVHEENTQKIDALRKGIKTNRIIQICGILVLLVILYLTFAK